MPKTSQLDVIMQQQDALSLAELLAVKGRVNALIESHSLPFNINQSPLIESNLTFAVISGEKREKRELESNQTNSLEKVTELVDEWMADESGYDEETYPQIEAALNQNQPSL